MRPGVVEIKTKSVPEGTAQRDSHPVKRRFTCVHPRGHGAALDRKERVAACDGETLSREVGTRRVAIPRMKAIEIASVVVTVHAPKVIGRRASGKTNIFQTREQILNEGQRWYEAWILPDGSCCQTRIVQGPNIQVILFPRDSRFRFFEILERRVDISFQ